MKNRARLFLDRMTGARLAPLALFILLPALLVRLQYVAVPPEAARLWVDCFIGDTRSWWKAVAVAGIGLWMLFHAAARLLGGWRPRFVFLGGAVAAAMAAVLVSTLLSEYPVTAWLGYVTSYEGALVLLAYLAGAWYAAEMPEGPGERLLLLRLIGCVGMLNAVHGLGEGMGWHFWRTGAGQWLMGAEYPDLLFRFADSRMAYGTVFQPNHFGMFMALVYALALGMPAAETRPPWRLFWRITAGLSAGALFFSNSRAAILVAAGLTAVCLAGALRRAVRGGRGAGKFYPLKSVPALLAVPVTLLLLLACFPEMRQAAERLVRRVMPVPAPDRGAAHQVRGVGLQDNRIQIALPESALSLGRGDDQTWRIFYPLKSASRELAFRDDAPGWRVAEIPGVDAGTLRCGDSGNVRLLAPGVDLPFLAVGAGIFALDPVSRQLRAEIPRATYRPHGREGLMSGRGYIWGRLPPLVRAAPWFGHGPGSFALVFPNDDLLSRQRYAEGRNEDKGHGIWATAPVQNGMIGLALYCLLAAYAYGRVLCGPGPFRLPLLLSLLAYLACSLSNDSTAGVTPVFCVLLGLGVGDAHPTRDAPQSPSPRSIHPLP